MSIIIRFESKTESISERTAALILKPFIMVADQETNYQSKIDILKKSVNNRQLQNLIYLALCLQSTYLSVYIRNINDERGSRYLT
jgi:hypothetical protein